MEHKHPPGGPHPPPPGRVCAAHDERKSLQEVWDKHLVAFCAQDLDTIMLDFDENSEITNYNQTTGTKTVYEGVEAIRSLFAGIFTVFTKASDLEILVADVSEEGRTVFFVWKLPAAGLPDGTDTFVFGENNKIHRQTTVVRTG